MLHHTEIHLLPTVLGNVPRLAGVNAELQEYADRSNFWDWLADSGFQAVRQFHPELNLRRRKARAGAWGEVRTEADYAARRAFCRAEPAAAFDPADYAFTDNIPWLGVPDEVVAKTCAAGLRPIVSVGAYPRMFERCILPQMRLTSTEAKRELLDWEAGVCLHEYAFALIWHYAKEYGVRDFTTINEPENQLMCWFITEDLRWVEQPAADNWAKLFRDDRQPTGAGRKLLGLIADQYAATARIVRDALEDVQTILRATEDDRIRLRLHGPTNVVWKEFWTKASTFLDSLDLHHYNPDPASMRQVFTLASHKAHALSKPLSCTEFNRRSGGTDLVDFAFNWRSAFETVQLYLQALQIGTFGPADCDLACLYLFSFPSTHRNYKHLVYGDMNLLDWTGRDQKPWNLPVACYPTFEEQQLRFATPAYHMIRMINRALRRDSECAPAPVWLQYGLNNPTSAGPDDLYFFLKIHVLRNGDAVFIFILNDSDQTAERVLLDTSSLDITPQTFVIRLSDKNHADQLHAYGSTGNEPLLIGKVPPQSLLTIRLGPDLLANMHRLRLVEETFTPGNLLHTGTLQLWQTTRLAAIGEDISGHTHRLPDDLLQWHSSCPQALSVGSGGLVQRIRNGAGPVTLTVTTADGRLQTQLSIEDPLPIASPTGNRHHLGTAGLAEV